MVKTLCADYESIQNTANFIRMKVDIKPTIGIICGSGLSKLADGVENPQSLNYEDIPNFPCATVAGHEGRLVFGKLGGKNVVVMMGRFHFYEGYLREHIAIPIRVMKLLGVETLLVSNAAGGLNPKFKLGDLVVIKDHISLPGLSQNNILIGPNDKRFGGRFVATSDAYNSQLRKTFKEIAEKMGSAGILRDGVYVHVSGPTYESPAECRMLHKLGADVVGMSTVPEVVVARHAGIRVFAISLVTNMSVMDEESTQKANHEEVLSTAATRTETLGSLFTELLKQM